MRTLFISALLFLSISSIAQVRQGSCRGTSIYDRFYITPYLGIGSATIKSDTNDYRSFTWMAGIEAHYAFERFRLGLGLRYQGYAKPEYALFKPYINAEIPFNFGEFLDYGLYLDAGPALDVGSDSELSGFFGEGGLYFNIVLNSFSGLYLNAGYAYNSLEYKWFLSNKPMSISEIKMHLGYRMWF